MGYRSIAALLSTGKATSQLLWKYARDNFDSHEDRITELEASDNAVPAAFIFAYAGSSAPTGYLLCDGSAVSQATYADLFAVIGLTYGDPGGGNFNLPDFCGRMVVGRGTGSGLTARALADSDGAETVTLDAATLGTHAHGITDPGHFHGGSGALNRLANGAGASTGWPTGTGATVGDTSFNNGDNDTTPAFANTGGGGSHNNMQPSLVLNFIIKT